MASLSLEGVACARGGRTLFEGLDLSIDAGGAAIVTGPNGAGKSSLLRLIAGLLVPAAGRIACHGRVALASDDLALDRQATLAKALGFWSAIDGGISVAEALTAFDMTHLADVPVRILSAGQRKRAALARTLASGADIWLLDEPGNGLDVASLERLGEAIVAHRGKGGIVLAPSHQPLDLPGAVPIALG